MKIKTNNRARDLVTFYDIPEKMRADFDYLSDDEKIDARLVMYKGRAVDVHDTVAIGRNVAPHPQRAGWEKWDSYSDDSFFSGLLFRMIECDRVIVATYYA